MLTRRQARKLERAHRLDLLFSKKENQDAVNAFKPFLKEVNGFRGNLKAADAAAKGKEVKVSPEDAKTELKHEIAKELSVRLLSTKSYAMTYENPTLAAAMNEPESDIYGRKDEDIQPFFEAEYDLIRPLFEDPNYADYEVTKEVMDAIGVKVTKFHGMIGQPKVVQVDYSVANVEVDTWLDAIALNVEHFDLLVMNLADKYPGFVTAYYENARLGIGEVRHSGIEGMITKKTGGEPVANAVISLENTDKKAVSGLPGDYRLVEVKRGWYYVVVTVAGVQVVRVLHKVVQGKVVRMDFEI